MTTWDNTGDTGPDSGNSSSLLPFYTSGSNALFATINGAYQPVINMNVSLPGDVGGAQFMHACIFTRISHHVRISCQTVLSLLLLHPYILHLDNVTMES